ncbi:MAG: ammonium transporter [Lachnospiraceae bacterium]|nr:ammonium transporter [Lachnospiraceae bacterium]
MDTAELTRALNVTWVLIAGALVFFMQAGFAMVETGFTRSKNAGNIIMKNLMDFAIGSIIFFLIGFGLMFGASAGGFVGTTGFFNPASLQLDAFETLTPGTFIFFQTVFCATAATIVSGAMAERTKFISYCVYSFIISLVIYPVVGHWAWGGGWLSELGFVDFAGSTVVHSVGGWAALVGAAIIGPRIGKYGKNGEVNAIPGHNIPIGALGVFILWFGWFGFNPGSTLGASLEIGHVAMTTNLAAAAATIVVMVVTWLTMGKPDVSMTLNGSLAGLVAITAGCQVVTMWGSIAIGVIAGFAVVFFVGFFDRCKIDDPVGATSVHLGCGVIGTLLVGLFANYAPGTDGAITGLLYGGGLHLLGVQFIGAAAVGVWTAGTAFIMFTVIKKTIGLRVDAEEEIRGLDVCEHNGPAYGDFMTKF